MRDCILIKNKDLEEIKENHPNKKLLDKIQELEKKLIETETKLYQIQVENSVLKETPEIRIDPMKMRIILLQREKTTQHDHYLICDSYSSIDSVNFSLEEKLRAQLLRIKDLVTKNILTKIHKKIIEDEQWIIVRERKYIANMGYLARRKLLKKYKK